MPENVIRMMCPNLKCKAILGVPAEARGRVVRCKQCGTNIRIPRKGETPVTQPAAAPPPPAPAADVV
ncbi:MAG: hypothetical protein IBJ11_03210 [Phycisphaerales bacterium]|nr:hypothetical protein [Phycisphaerales bacterium]